MNFEFIESSFTAFNKLKVLVIGDGMIDSYQWGEINRTSPEAPVPVIDVIKQESRLGGAANVAKNINALGATVTLCCTIGKDEAGSIFLDLMKKSNLNTSGILTILKPTTIKTRVIANNKHIVRIDNEDKSLIKNEEEFILKVENLINSKKFDVAIFQDYNKGTLSKNIIKNLIKTLKKHNIKIAADPKEKNFFNYKEIDLFKPNLKELNIANKSKIKVNEIKNVLFLMKQINSKLSANIIMTTLSNDGIIINKNNKHCYIKGMPIKAIDVSGAGDSVISIAALCIAQNMPIDYIAKISNHSGAQVCEKIGVVTIDKKGLLKNLKEIYS